MGFQSRETTVRNLKAIAERAGKMAAGLEARTYAPTDLPSDLAQIQLSLDVLKRGI